MYFKCIVMVGEINKSITAINWTNTFQRIYLIVVQESYLQLTQVTKSLSFWKTSYVIMWNIQFD